MARSRVVVSSRPAAADAPYPSTAMDIVDMAAIASRLGTTPGMIDVWRRRPAVGFPPPTWILAIGPVWNWGVVLAWSKRPRRAGRPARAAVSGGHHL